MKSKVKEIDFKLLIVLLSGIFFSSTICFGITSICIFLYILKGNYKIKKSKNLNIICFIVIFILGCVMSFYNSLHISNKELIRYVFYTLSPIVYLYFGFLTITNKDIKVILRTIFIATLINIIVIYIQIGMTIVKYGLSFSILRSAKSKLSNLLIFTIFIYFIKDKKERIISKSFDNIIFILDIIAVMMTFSRIHLLYIIIGFVIFTIYKWNTMKYQKIFILLLVTLCIFMVFVWVNPTLNSLVKYYIAKIEKSMQEVSTSQKWDFVEINNSWRGYEKYIAQKQYSEADIISKFFGLGIKGVFVGDYAQLVSKDLKDGYLPVLHNGYYGVLIYSGIVGVIAYIVFFVKHILRAMKNYKNEGIAKYNLLYLITCAQTIVSAYLVMGIISSTNTNIQFCILIGILSNLDICANKNINELGEKL